MPELSDIPIDQMAQAQQRALMRLHVKVTGETHRLLTDLVAGLRKRLLEYADEDGKLTPEFYLVLVDYAGKLWADTFGHWRTMFEAARREAVAIPFGALVREHQYFMGLREVEERRGGRLEGWKAGRLEEQGPVRVGVQGVPFFEQQIQEILDATSNRIYSDGFKLSQRIWRLDQESLGGIQQILRETLATGDSAWNAAKKLEAYLGPGADCPRWTSTRLFRLTKSDIAAGDKRGLISGNPCESKGVAYNALRLARNEIQIAHHAAKDMVMARQPWTEMERILLSPAHPVEDICDDVVGGGENGDGVYPKGTIILPLHVQCICYKQGVRMPADEFIQKLKGWMTNEAAWPEMDAYALWVNLEPPDLRVFKTFAKLAEMRAWGKEAFAAWEKDLPEDERAALISWLSHDNININNYLHGLPLDERLELTDPAEIARRVALMDQAIARGSVPENLTVWRGFTLSDMKAEDLVGKVISDQGSVSTSLAEDRAHGFVWQDRKPLEGAVMAEIRIPKGARAAYIENIGSEVTMELTGRPVSEYELLLGRGSQFKVLAVEERPSEFGRPREGLPYLIMELVL
jgi:hypothetical protein